MGFEDFLPESQRLDLALTVLYVPHSLDSGLAPIQLGRHAERGLDPQTESGWGRSTHPGNSFDQA